MFLMMAKVRRIFLNLYHLLILSCRRYDEFLSTFQTVWMKVDEEEISETRFRQLFQQLSSKSPFSPEEVDANIEQLCNEGKLMKSDGTLFKI